MDLLRKHESILIAFKLALAVPICLYYAGIYQESELIHVPTYVWIVVLIYTILQFVNKQINQEIPIHISIFYYIGLLSIGLPVFLVSRFQKIDWLIVSKIGCWFLVISVLWQMRLIVQQKNTKQ